MGHAPQSACAQSPRRAPSRNGRNVPQHECPPSQLIIDSQERVLFHQAAQPLAVSVRLTPLQPPNSPSRRSPKTFVEITRSFSKTSSTSSRLVIQHPRRCRPDSGPGGLQHPCTGGPLDIDEVHPTCIRRAGILQCPARGPSSLFRIFC